MNKKLTKEEEDRTLHRSVSSSYYKKLCDYHYRLKEYLYSEITKAVIKNNLETITKIRRVINNIDVPKLAYYLTVKHPARRSKRRTTTTPRS